jgi:hypothetical protein
MAYNSVSYVLGKAIALLACVTALCQVLHIRALCSDMLLSAAAVVHLV